MEAIRDQSAATGMTRTVGFVLASYANALGGDVFPSIETVRLGTGARPVRNSKGRKELRGGATAKTVVEARRWFVDHGEAIIVGTRPSHTGTPVPILDFSPLLRKGSLGQPFESGKGSLGEVFDGEGLAEETPKGSQGEGSRVRPEPSKGSPSEPEPEGNANTESENETPDARAGARDSGLSPGSNGSVGLTPAQLAAELREDEAELATLEKQLPTSKHPEATQRSIDTLRERLAELEAVGA